MSRKGLTDKVMCEQRPERSEELAMLVSGGMLQARGTTNTEVKSKSCGSPSIALCEKQSRRQDPHTSLSTPSLFVFLTKGFKPHRKVFVHVINAFYC